MSKQIYNQPQISVSEQIQLLKSEGLSFKDEKRAFHLLQNISMFRMKSYLKPFRQHESHQFKIGSTFEEAYNIYKFDSELRKMVCSELEKIEVSVRTQLSLIMSDASGIYWFEDSANFRDANRHSSLLKSLDEELHRSDDDAIVAFQQNYSNKFPPSWMTFEVSSFGTLHDVQMAQCRSVETSGGKVLWPVRYCNGIMAALHRLCSQYLCTS